MSINFKGNFCKRSNNWDAPDCFNLSFSVSLGSNPFSARHDRPFVTPSGKIGKVLASAFGNRKDEVFLQLKALLLLFRISRFYTDDWGVYKRYLDASKHEVGKQNTQKIENKHLNLRTRIKRLARKTICFSKTVFMHDLVIGIFINRYEFGLLI
nr:IS1 family transposase [Synechocystis sp. PCC 7509]